MNVYRTQDEIQIMADYGKYLTLSAESIEQKSLPLVKIVHLPLTESIGDWKEVGEDIGDYYPCIRSVPSTSHYPEPWRRLLAFPLPTRT